MPHAIETNCSFGLSRIFFFPTNVGGLRGGLGGGLRDKPKKGRQTAKFRVSRETVVLRRWERSKQNFFGFVKRVDKTKKFLQNHQFSNVEKLFLFFCNSVSDSIHHDFIFQY